VGVIAALWTLLGGAQTPGREMEQAQGVRSPRTTSEMIAFLEDHSGSPGDWNRLGEMHLMDGQTESARTAFARAEQRYVELATRPPRSPRDQDPNYIASLWHEIGWLRLERLDDEPGAREAFKEGSEIIDVFIRLSPMRNPLYNLACYRAMAGDHDLAIDAFARAIDAGYENHRYASGDRDLDSLRDDPRFQQLMARIDPRRPD